MAFVHGVVAAVLLMVALVILAVYNNGQEGRALSKKQESKPPATTTTAKMSKGDNTTARKRGAARTTGDATSAAPGPMTEGEPLHEKCAAPVRNMEDDQLLEILMGELDPEQGRELAEVWHTVGAEDRKALVEACGSIGEGDFGDAPTEDDVEVVLTTKRLQLRILREGKSKGGFTKQQEEELLDCIVMLEEIQQHQADENRERAKRSPSITCQPCAIPPQKVKKRVTSK